MSPTTTSLENIHGHLNEETPRRNAFCASMCRLASLIEKSIERYSDSVRHNDNFACQRSRRESQNMGQTELNIQSCFYAATIEQCPYWRTLHLSRMFEQTVLCPHQTYCGAAICAWKTEAKLIYERGNTSPEIPLTIFSRVTKLEDETRRELLKILTRNNMRSFSKTKQWKGVIHSWVK
jgi:hypothetical protein